MRKNDLSFLRNLEAESLDSAFYSIAYPETNEFLRDPKFTFDLQAYVTRVYQTWRRGRNLTTPFILDIQYLLRNPLVREELVGIILKMGTKPNDQIEAAITLLVQAAYCRKLMQSDTRKRA